MKLSKDDTNFQFQYDLCIYMEFVIVQLRFHQIWPHWDIYIIQEILDKIGQSTKVSLFKLVALYGQLFNGYKLIELEYIKYRIKLLTNHIDCDSTLLTNHINCDTSTACNAKHHAGVNSSITGM